MNRTTQFIAGSIHDIPIGRGVQVSVAGHKIALYRETYGHFYAFEDDRNDPVCDLHNGTIQNGRICLENGQSVDLHTGRVNHSDRLLHSFIPWVENGIIFLSLAGLVF